MPRENLEAIIVHHAATTPRMKVNADVIDQWHRQRGWLAIGYHWVILRDGSIQPGRLSNQVGAHAGPAWNSRSIAICLAGGLDEKTRETVDNFTDEQYRSLSAICMAYGDLPVKLHKDVAETECSAIDLSRI